MEGKVKYKYNRDTNVWEEGSKMEDFHGLTNIMITNGIPNRNSGMIFTLSAYGAIQAGNFTIQIR